jgi:hypothetical protein
MSIFNLEREPFEFDGELYEHDSDSGKYERQGAAQPCRCRQHVNPQAELLDEYQDEQFADEADFEDDEELFSYEFHDFELASEVNRNSQNYIRWVQQALNRILGLRLNVDGIIGPQTRSAIRDFQRRRGLPADGIVGPATERAFVGAGVQAPKSGTGGCVGVAVNCLSMTKKDQEKVRRRGTKEGGFHDRTSGDRRINYAVQVVDYDVNDWLIRKPRHMEGLGRVVDFIIKRGQQTDQRIAVSITGSASRTGTKEYNDILSCKRAACVAEFLRTHVGMRSQSIASRVSIDPAGEGFSKAKCVGADCERPEYRSVLAQVHAPGRKPIPIPIVPPAPPTWDKYKVRCCSLKTENLFTGTLADIVDKGFDRLPPSVRNVLEKYPVLKKLFQGLVQRVVKEVKARILKKLPRLAALLNQLLRYIPVELVRDKAVFQIMERGKPAPKEITLCYTGYGVRVPIPRPDLLEAVPEPFRSHLERILDALVPREFRTIPPLESDCAPSTAFRDFTLNRRELLHVFSGPAGLGRGIKPGHVALTFKSRKFTTLVNRLSLSCSDCPGHNTIQLVVGSGRGFELAAGTEGELSVGCRCVECVNATRQFAAP